jgi:hypothetical protein
MDDLPPSSEAAAPAHAAPSSHGHEAHDDHGHDHHELPWIRKYVFSTDHKVIGIQYLWGGLAFLYFGFGLMLLMRWQIAFPGEALTWDNACLHIGYQLHQLLYHLGIDGTMPQVPVPIPPDTDPKHAPCFMQWLFGKDSLFREVRPSQVGPRTRHWPRFRISRRNITGSGIRR